mmetsp:Transcript_23432/g.36099  ORF Transcript_23432/g.36099 Transcript_23432/m.36099 type:complete len:242 (+) Transcript_23432:238-963(+)
MNLFLNRFLIVVGGECGIEGEDKPRIEENKNSNPEDSEQSSPQSKPLNDVWLFDIFREEWKEVTPTVKVQPTFNNKKLRKSFEPRMAHSANVIGNYILIFGGYNPFSQQCTPSNFNVLSLLGCSDFMLQNVTTVGMVCQEVLSKREEQLAKPDKKSVSKKDHKGKQEMKIVLGDIQAPKKKSKNASIVIMHDESKEPEIGSQRAMAGGQSSRITIDTGAPKWPPVKKESEKVMINLGSAQN